MDGDYKESESTKESAGSKTRAPSLVFQLGSHSIKYGRANGTPSSIISAMAIRRKSGGFLDSETGYEEPANLDGKLTKIMKEVCAEFQNSLRKLDAKLEAGEYEKVTGGDSTEVTEDESEFNWTDVSEKPQTVFGAQALRIPPSEPYFLFWPIQNGRLNVTSTYSTQFVLDQLELLMRHILQNMNIDNSEAANLSAIIIIPDDLYVPDIKSLCELFLNRLKLHSILFQVSSVCATFGFGVPTACVVDIGHQTTSISCVDEGLATPGSRIYMNYGGDNITRKLLWHLKHSERHPFPDVGFDVSDLRDRDMMNTIKEAFCHLEEEIPPDTIELRKRREGEPTKSHRVNASDAFLFAPLGLFRPQLLEPIPPYTTMYNPLIVDDPWEDEKEEANKKKKKKPDHDRHQNMALDKAIATSISLNYDPRRRNVAPILLVGGSSKFDGMREALENRVGDHLPENIDVDKLEVLAPKKELDQTFISWRGGAVMCQLEAAEEFFIRGDEWNSLGVRIVKDKTPFLWSP